MLVWEEVSWTKKTPKATKQKKNQQYAYQKLQNAAQYAPPRKNLIIL